eukprot:gene41092-50854_t
MSSESTNKDMSASFYLDFTSGSSFFTAGLSATNCDIDYLLQKDGADVQRTFLSNVKVSNVALKPTTHMFSTTKTSHEITFDVSNTQFESLYSSLESEASSLSTPSDKSYLEATCQTTLQFGSLSSPYTHRQMISLEAYKSSLQSEVASLKAMLANPNEGLQAVASYILIALSFASLFGFLQVFQPHAFHATIAHGPDGKLNWSDLMYFSFTVLTSTGFGEITPATPMARSLIVIEQVLGVMYVAFLIARLANMYGSTKHSR